jgi:hypothetical protein
MLGAGVYDWCIVENSNSNTASIGIDTPLSISNTSILMSGASFNYALQWGDTYAGFNVRLEGTAGVTSGSRLGLTTGSAGGSLSNSTVIGFAGGGVLMAAGSSTTRRTAMSRCTVVNCGTYGVKGNGAASQTVIHTVTNCYFSGNTYGIDANAARMVATGNRLRDSTSGNFANMGNYPETYNYTTDSDDPTEFVDSGAGDYRVKNTAAIWGKGYGAGDEPAAASGGGIQMVRGMAGGMRG